MKPAASFRSTWRRLAANGIVDHIDGAEYNRVWRQWIEANAPAEMEQYILADQERQREIAEVLSRLSREGGTDAAS